MEKQEETEAQVIHVIVRTHKRKELFEKCIESIASQDYKHKKVHVIADDDFTARYVKEHIAKGEIDFYYRVDGGMAIESAGVFKRLLRNGLVKPRDNSRCQYNLYLNYVIRKLSRGWVFVVDDDKELPDRKVLSAIARQLTHDDVMVVGQYAMKSRTVPDGEMWKQVPFARGHIDMSCCVWHVKHRDVAVFDAHKASDWRVANYLVKVTEIKWLKRVFVKADNDGLFGKVIDK